MLPAKSATVTICLALLMGMLLPGCDNKTDSSKSVAEKPSGPWEGKFETVIGSWDDLQKIVKSHKGKVVVVDMWSTWCEPCKKELPELALLQKNMVTRLSVSRSILITTRWMLNSIPKRISQ
jgi:thiol-disulfide isomerase/thioredoxin